MTDNLCYKVLRRMPDGTLRSAVTTYPYEVTYSPAGNPARAPVGGLLAFEHKVWALRFAAENLVADTTYEIWLAAGQEPIHLPSAGLGVELSTLSRMVVEDAWMDLPINPAHLLVCWPEGTVAYKQLRLLSPIAVFEPWKEEGRV